MKLQSFLVIASLTYSVTAPPVYSGERLKMPILPKQHYSYAFSTAPDFLEKELTRLDNTPKENPLTDAGATLGRVLFYDTHLSKNNKIACASCHIQKKAFSDPRRFSVGYKGGHTTRNAMSLVNLRFTHISGGTPGFFWDERASTLEAQVLMPIQDKVEMGMNLKDLEEKLQKIPYYPPLFKGAFGSSAVTSDRIAKAVAQFMRAMVSFDSKFDRAAKKVKDINTADFPTFTAEENLGKSLFIEGLGRVAEIGCAHCHIPPTFGMRQSLNNGLDSVYRDKGLGARKLPTNDPFTPSNDGKFKAPSLRNVALTAPYMHDGRFKTLDEVIDHYSSGVHSHPNLGLAVQVQGKVKGKTRYGFGYNVKQKAALIAFLKTLTDQPFIADPRFSDPFVKAKK